MSMDSKDDIVIKIVIIGKGGHTLEIQKQAWDVQDVTIRKLREKVKGSRKIPEDPKEEGCYLDIELSWMDKNGDQVRLQEDAELALALKEMKAVGLTVVAGALLKYYSIYD